MTLLLQLPLHQVWDKLQVPNQYDYAGRQPAAASAAGKEDLRDPPVSHAPTLLLLLPAAAMKLAVAAAGKKGLAGRDQAAHNPGLLLLLAAAGTRLAAANKRLAAANKRLAGTRLAAANKRLAAAAGWRLQA